MVNDQINFNGTSFPPFKRRLIWNAFSCFPFCGACVCAHVKIARTKQQHFYRQLMVFRTAKLCNNDQALQLNEANDTLPYHWVVVNSPLGIAMSMHVDHSAKYANSFRLPHQKKKSNETEMYKIIRSDLLNPKKYENKWKSALLIFLVFVKYNNVRPQRQAQLQTHRCRIETCCRLIKDRNRHQP